MLLRRFEKVMSPLILISAKHYTGLYWTNPDTPDKIFNRGIETERRDNAPMVGKTLRLCQHALMWDGDPKKAMDCAKDAVKRVLMSEWEFEDYIISAELTKEPGDYKGTPPAHAYVTRKKRRRDPSNAPLLGDRVPYVILPTLHGVKSSESAEDPERAKRDDEQPDGDYYIEHQLRKPIERMFIPVVGEEKTRTIFTGEHTRKRRRVLPKKGGLMDFFVRK